MVHPAGRPTTAIASAHAADATADTAAIIA